jgi:cell shape-determining protein MreD
VTGAQLAVEIAGWIGAALILLAYVLVTVGRLTGQSLAFQWMNLVGAAGFVINGWWHRALPSAALNVVWMLIAAVALWQLWKRKGSSTSAM